MYIPQLDEALGRRSMTFGCLEIDCDDRAYMSCMYIWLCEVQPRHRALCSFQLVSSATRP